MSAVKAAPIPEVALLHKYSIESASDGANAYADCYSVEISRSVSLAEFVFAFYTTPVFKLERLILRFLAKSPSTDNQAQQLADGSIHVFAAWNEEQRADNQLLMCDFRGRTRSWFMVTPQTLASGQSISLLRFGSAIVPEQNRQTGKLEIGGAYKIVLGFHKLYSRILLGAAKRHLDTLAAGN